MYRLVWHQSKQDPKRYERPTDEAENFYTSLAKAFEGTGRTFFAITGHVRLSIQVTDEGTRAEVESRLCAALRRAWRRLRYQHPTIASWVEWDPNGEKYKKVYQSLPNSNFPESRALGQAEDAWHQKSFIVHREACSGVEFCNSDPPVNKGHATVYLFTNPIGDDELDPSTFTLDLVLRSHHDIIDGIGTLLLLNNLLRHAAEAYRLQDDYPEVPFGDEVRHLSPAFRAAANIAPEPTEEHKERLQSILAANTAMVEDVEVISVPFKNKTASPGKNQRVAITLTEAETAHILQKCKSAGASVTQAFHTAIVLAVRDLQNRTDQPRKARYINYCLINLRDRCSAPYNSTTHPAAVYHSASGRSLAIDVTIPGKSPLAETPEQLKEDYRSILQQVRTFYLRVQNDPDHVAMVPLYFSTKIAPYPGDACPPIPPPNQTPSVSISSMGVVDKIIQRQHGPIRVHDPWVTGDELGTGIGVFLGTWDGRLSVSAGFNETYHDMADVVGFLKNLKGIVIRALE